MSEHLRDDLPLNGPGPEDEAKLQEMMGHDPELEGTAVVAAENVGRTAGYTTTDQYQMDPMLEEDNVPDEADDLNLLTTQELRAGETDDAMEAVEEGLAYIPPIDPPTVVSDDLQDAEVASGFGVSALDAPYDEDHHATPVPNDDEMSQRVRDALRADSATTEYADRLQVETRDGVVILTGEVISLDDSDFVAAVASRVSGVTEVIDRTRIAGMDDRS